MDQKTFDKGWKVLAVRYHLREDDERAPEYFRHLKAKILPAPWLAVCDALALTTDEDERDRFLPVVGDLARHAQKYGADGKPRPVQPVATFCGECMNGSILFVSAEFTFAPRGEATFQPISVRLPPDASRTLEWFNRFLSYPVTWTLRLTSCFCDCRQGALDAQERKDNADPHRSGDRTRSAVYRELLGLAVPPKDKQDVRGVISDFGIMLSETFPMAESAMDQADIWKALDLRRKYLGDLVYQVGTWAVMLGGIGGARQERPAAVAPPPKVTPVMQEKPKAHPLLAKIAVPEPRPIAVVLDTPKVDHARRAANDLDDDDRPWGED